MANIMVGSARIGENGKITGGARGDQKQTVKINDLTGEVSSQKFYVHSKGWNIFRPKKIEHANAIARENKYACDNANIGYNQDQRYDVVNQSKKVASLKDITTKVNSDCSSLTRAEIITALKVDVGDFTTYSCKDVLLKSGLFEFVGKFVSQEKTPVYNGDILCTCTKGHVVTVNEGNPRKATSTATKTTTQYYKKCASTCTTISEGLTSIGVDASKAHRIQIAKANGMTTYTGTSAENTKLLNLLKAGKLIVA